MNKGLKIVFWIIFFPIMFTIFVVKNTWKKPVKIVTLSILWLFTVIFWMTPSADAPVGTADTDVEVVDAAEGNEQSLDFETETDTDTNANEAVAADKSVEANSGTEPASLDTSSTLQEESQSTIKTQPSSVPEQSIWLTSTIKNLGYSNNKLLEVYGGNLSGYREASVKVDIGFGVREYWAFTNQYGQLVAVIAEEVVLQDDNTEPVTDNGRYYPDEAKVSGTERSDLDEGHVIADSLGGVSNAYNITPQDSTLNRYGDQAYMEKWIREAGGCSEFVAVITYPNTTTQIPSHYSYTYTLMGNVINDEFDNVNPDEVNTTVAEKVPVQEQTPTPEPEPIVEPTPEPIATPEPPVTQPEHDISSIDTNGNGTVTIAEAKAAGYTMPITSDHWLYKYMIDRDGDGMVGE